MNDLRTKLLQFVTDESIALGVTLIYLHSHPHDTETAQEYERRAAALQSVIERLQTWEKESDTPPQAG